MRDAVLQLARSTFRYTSTKDGQAPLRMRLKELAATSVRYGYRRLHILLQREGQNINATRVCRLYCEENLSLLTKPPKRRVGCRKRSDRPGATRINDCWAVDFMTDELFDGRRVCLLTKVDHFTRQSIAVDVSQRSRGKDVVSTLERIGASRSYPKTIRVDNGPEFTSKAPIF